MSSGAFFPTFNPGIEFFVAFFYIYSNYFFKQIKESCVAGSIILEKCSPSKGKSVFWHSLIRIFKCSRVTRG